LLALVFPVFNTWTLLVSFAAAMLNLLDLLAGFKVNGVDISGFISTELVS
jgi:hypothetical protein